MLSFNYSFAFSGGRLSPLAGVRKHIQQRAQAMKDALAADWHGSRCVPLGLALLVITSVATASFYVGQPTQPEFSYDSASYLQVTHNIMTSGNPVDPLRTPGYPLLITVVYLLAGVGNFFAVSVVQGVLFVVATLEIYALTVLLLRRSWVAFMVGVLVGTNTYLVSFIKPIIVEGFALWLTASLALVVVLFVKSLKPRYFWLSAGCMLLLFMTRPEWVYLPIPLVVYLLFVARRHGKLRRLVPHGLAAVVVLYAALGLFVGVNATQNGYPGVSYVQRINLLGKVLQYHMQGEAPPEYAGVQQELEAFAARGGWNPYDLLVQYPDVTAHQWALGGSYASAVVLHHPFQFLADSVYIFFTSSNQYRAFDSTDTHGPVATPPFKPEVSLSAYVAQTYRFFPLFALLWGVLLFWRRTRLGVVEAMGAVVLIALYELVMTTVGGYSMYDYERIHVPFDPMMIVVIWGTALASLPYWQGAIEQIRLSFRAVWWLWGAVAILALAGSVVIAWVTKGISAAVNPHTWLVTQVLLAHPPRVLTVLALAAFITLLCYRASRRQPEASGERQPVESIGTKVS